MAPLRVVFAVFLLLGAPAHPQPAPKYELLLRGGHLIDPRNGLNGTRDVALAGGRIAAVAQRIDAADAAKTVDAAGLYVVPGLVDIHTHVYSGVRGELEDAGRLNAALWEARTRGVIFDVGHGGGSFAWRVAVPAIKERFLPDSISTDLHTASMNAGMKDMLNVMSKFLALGLSLDDVVRRATWNAARELKQDSLGHLSVGATADVAVVRLERRSFGFVDSFGARLKGGERLACELTLRDGKVVYDLNGLTQADWR